MTKPLNIGMIGYGFMGRAHSNAYGQVNHFFDPATGPSSRPSAAATTTRLKALRRPVGLRIASRPTGAS